MSWIKNQGFKTLTLIISKNETIPRELYIKEHSSRHQENNKPAGKTLFVLNIPSFMSEDILIHLFSLTGKVLDVFLQDNTKVYRNGFKTACIVFAKREDLQKALQSKSLSLLDYPFQSVLHKWIDNYNDSIHDPSRLSKEINIFMLNYDKCEAQSKKHTGEIDDEGWIVVTKKGRNPGIARKESVNTKLDRRISQSSKKKELKDFYTFQIKESKQKNLAMLRKNYEEAKRKVNIMKSSRRFKPY